MKKRLRKKLRLREFQEMGFHIDFNLDLPVAGEEEDVFWVQLINMVESRNLQIGGGLTNFYATGLHRCTATEADRAALAGWLGQQPAVRNVRIGPLIDAWYGPFE